jgi:hypothetical protein
MRETSWPGVLMLLPEYSDTAVLAITAHQLPAATLRFSGEFYR